MKRLFATLFLALAALPPTGAEPWLWTETVELRFQSARPVGSDMVEDEWDARIWIMAGPVDEERELMSPGQTLRVLVNPAQLLECVTHVFRADMYDELYPDRPDGADRRIPSRPRRPEYDFGSASFAVDVAILDREHPRRLTVPVTVRHLEGAPTQWEVVFIVTIT